jgi:hypothetical protein
MRTETRISNQADVQEPLPHDGDWLARLFFGLGLLGLPGLVIPVFMGLPNGIWAISTWVASGLFAFLLPVAAFVALYNRRIAPQLKTLQTDHLNRSIHERKLFRLRCGTRNPRQ